MNSKFKKKFMLLLLITFSLLLISGCTPKINTTLNINNNCIGSRVMKLSLPRTYIDKNVNGGQKAFDSLINIDCPTELSVEKNLDNLYCNYIFTLQFSSKDEYINKVESILGRKTGTVFCCSETPFSNGVRIKEDFTSSDLLGFIKTKARELNLISGEDVDLLGNLSTSVSYNGVVSEQGDNVDFSQMKSVDLKRINIVTTPHQNGSFSRSVGFTVSNNAYNDNFDQISEYLNSRVPKGDTGYWVDGDGEKVFNIDCANSSIKELNKKTNTIFDTESSQASFSKNIDKLSSTKYVFKEGICLDAFLNSDNKVDVEYSFVSNENFKISKLYEDNIEQYGESNENVFTINGRMDKIDIDAESETDYSPKNIIVNTKDNGDGTFEKNIAFELKDEKFEDSKENMLRYLRARNSNYADISVCQNTINVLMNGTAQEINLGLNSLFGGNNSIYLDSNIGFNSVSSFCVKDNIDFTSLCNDISYNSDVKYKFISANNINNAVISQTEEILNPQDKKILEAQFKYSNPREFTVDSSKINVLFVVIISVATTLALVVLVVLFCKIIRFVKMKNTKVLLPENNVLVLEKTGDNCKVCSKPIYKGMIYCIHCGNIVGEVKELEDKDQEKD